ncbi:MAG: molybdopterin-binding protein [Saprospiraceae bacterium]
MRTLLIFVLIDLLGSEFLSAQRVIPTTDTLKIFGLVKVPIVLSVTELDTFTKVKVKDQIIYNHSGEIKDTLDKLIGIRLSSVLSLVDLIYDKPKLLNEFYFVFTASDGYKVVFSWNEIYNSQISDKFFIITEMGGKQLVDLSQRIMFMSTGDIKNGRRYIKGLKTIEVKRVD